MTGTQSRARATDQRFYGLSVGLVSDANDPNGQGRVKLTLPWFDPDMVTEWARVVNPYAGPDYGLQWTPEKDTEVVVAFEHGDMRFPYVLGVLFNGQDKAPAQRSSARDQKVFRTKHGHQLVFDDGGGSEKVELTTHDGHRLTLDDNGNEIVLAHKDGPKVTMTSQKISIEATEIEIKASGNVTVQGSQIQLN
jgi:uncharacterized protein involved in type VI secretion and phage assembly